MTPHDALRRADWRWLLPTPRVGRALCLADGAVAESVAAAGAALAERVERRRGGERVADEAAFDLVVTSDLQRATLETATTALGPGGTLVAVLARDAHDACRRLARAPAFAFHDVRAAVPWPSPDDARAWLPLDGGGARYFLRDRPLAARHPARRVLLRVRGALDHATLRARGAVVVARRGDDAAPWWTRVAGAADGDWMLLAPSRRVESRVLGMTLGRDGRPDAVVKLSRTPDSARRMATGAAVLERLHAAGLSAARMAPSPLGAVRDGDVLVATLESAVDGVPLDAAVRRRTLVPRLEEMTDWLITLARATRGAERADTWARVFAPTVERFTDACGATLDRALLDVSVAMLAAAGPQPTVLEHHDFRPWNVYALRDGALAAFDWDNARVDGLPGLDLLHGMTTLAFALDGAYRGGRLAESRRRQERGAVGAARRGCVARYVDAVGMTRDAFRAVQAFAWMARAADDALALPTLGRQPFVELWDAEARLALSGRV